MVPIIEVAELLKIYQNPEVLIFDVSNGKDAKANFETEHIDGATFVDLNTQLADIREDAADGGRHPLPDPVDFAKTLTELGISRDSHVVIYDDKNGSNAAARFWWMLKSAGHQKVQVLNGGLNQARKDHFPMSSEVRHLKNPVEPYRIDKWNLPTVTVEEVAKVAQKNDYLVVDVRDKERFEGKTEPIDLVAGHIPGAINVPFTGNLDANGLFLSPDKLREKYEQVFEGIVPENRIVHCGSGVTACHTLLALNYAGMQIPNLYVGSWSEWSRSNRPIETRTS